MTAPDEELERCEGCGELLDEFGYCKWCDDDMDDEEDSWDEEDEE